MTQMTPEHLFIQCRLLCHLPGVLQYAVYTLFILVLPHLHIIKVKKLKASGLTNVCMDKAGLNGTGQGGLTTQSAMS